MTEEDYCKSVTSEYAEYINKEPELLSLLYDVDLLPEQVRTLKLPANAMRMAAICVLFKRWKDLENKKVDA
jgi:hypothetical protein